MAVYTNLGAEQIAGLIAAYDVGELLSAKGIAEGISNSNWLVETTEGRFILTLYERRIEAGDLPFFLGLLDHLAARGCAVPRTIHDRQGHSLRTIDDKAAALIEFLPGVSPSHPSPAQARAVGSALARVHLAALDFPMERANRLDPAFNRDTLANCGLDRLASIDPGLAEVLEMADAVVAQWPRDLPCSVIHSDLFPDNVLMLGDRVSGMIDFYFACTDAMAYDLAVTHAAWSFAARGDRFDRSVGLALVDGYRSIRPLSNAELGALPMLAQGACLRFAASRAEDWLNPPEDAQVMRKDPMDFLRRWRFYAENSAQAFA